MAFLNFWNTDESDYYSDVSTAIEHIKKKLEFTYLYLSGKNKTKNKSAQPADDESNDSDTCPMIPIHICATIHKLNCFYY